MDRRMDRMENIFERLAGSIAKNRDEAHAANDELNAKIEGAATKQIERDEKLNATVKNGQNAVTKKITDIEQRFQRLERDPIERPTSQRAGRSADGSLSVAQPDPWASSRWGAGGPTSSVGPPAPPASHPAATAQTRSSEFFPELVHIKGWSFYGEKGTGITQANALALGARVKSRLPLDIQNLILNTRAPMLVNYQVSFRVARGEACWRLQDAVQQALLEVPELVGGRPAYSVVGQSPAARRKNATIAKARSALLQVAPRPDHIRAEFRAGVIYWSPQPNSDEDLLPLGKMIKANSRAWTPECLRDALPDLDFSALTAATVETMAE